MPVYIKFHLPLLDNAITSTIGTCRLATSQYLPSLAEAAMYARGALSLEDVLPDGCILRSGDRAEELTSGVATKREESPLRLGPRKRNSTPRLSQKTTWISCQKTTDVGRD